MAKIKITAKKKLRQTQNLVSDIHNIFSCGGKEENQQKHLDS